MRASRGPFACARHLEHRQSPTFVTAREQRCIPYVPLAWDTGSCASKVCRVKALTVPTESSGVPSPRVCS